MFINLSNHPSNGWSKAQIEEAIKYGNIKDIDFPIVPPQATSKEIDNLVTQYFELVVKQNPKAVMLQGEFTFSFRLIVKLKQIGIKVVAACSDRVTHEYVDEAGVTRKNSEFRFIQFREY